MVFGFASNHRVPADAANGCLRPRSGLRRQAWRAGSSSVRLAETVKSCPMNDLSINVRGLKIIGMSTKPALRLSTLIANETSGAITLNRLAELINEANREAGTGCFLNRRTLAKIKNMP